MKLLRLILVSLSLATSLIADNQEQDISENLGDSSDSMQNTQVLGTGAIDDLLEVESANTTGDVSKNDGTYFVIDSIDDLPTQVKPGAIIKIKKQTIDPKDDAQRTVVIDSINSTQAISPDTSSDITETDETDKDGIYHVIHIPKKLKRLEFEVVFDVQTVYPKLAIYKHGVHAHTFEVEQPEEGWSFGNANTIEAAIPVT